MGREDALMARKITKRQQQIYDFIKEYQQEKGYPPSVREMASAVGLSSPSTVHAHLSAPGGARATQARCHQTARPGTL